MIRQAVWQLGVAFAILAAALSSSVHAQCVESDDPAEMFRLADGYLVLATVADGRRRLTTSFECGWAQPEGTPGGRMQRWLTERAIKPTAPGHD